MNKIPFIETYLNNGIKVIMSRNKRIPIVILLVGFRVGSKMEPEGKKGIAHLLEHLMFSCKIGKDKIDFDKLLSLNGGYSNAATGYDYTYYYIQIPSYKLEFAATLDSERFNRVIFDDEIVNIQKKVVIEEKYENYDNSPYGDVEFLYTKNLFKNTDYEVPVIGLKNNIKNINSSDLISFYDDYYNADNCIIIVTGNIDYLKTEEILNKYYNTLPAKESKRYKFIDNDFKSSIVLYPESKVKIELNGKFIFFKTNARNTKDYYVLKIISILLSDGFSSRLYKNLIYDRKIAQMIYAQPASYQHSGDFEISVLFANKKYNSDIETIIFNELENLKEGDYTNEELEKAKNKIHLAFSTGHQKNISIAQSLLSYELFNNNVGLINDDINNYLMVTRDDIKNTIKKYLDFNKKVVITYLKD